MKALPGILLVSAEDFYNIQSVFKENTYILVLFFKAGVARVGQLLILLAVPLKHLGTQAHATMPQS